MHADALIQPPFGPPCEFVPSDVVGRHSTLAPPIGDGRVSEAHAMVFLRMGALRSLALRGGLLGGWRPLDQLTLPPGPRVTLAGAGQAVPAPALHETGEHRIAAVRAQNPGSVGGRRYRSRWAVRARGGAGLQLPPVGLGGTGQPARAFVAP